MIRMKINCKFNTETPLSIEQKIPLYKHICSYLSPGGFSFRFRNTEFRR